MKKAMVLLMGLAACGAPRGAEEAASADRDGRIECAPAGADRFARDCLVERASGRDGPVLTLRKPDGGFRRLEVTNDGRGVAAADGAEPAQVTILDDRRIEVAIGDDRFRLPATVDARR
jgi:hypothetical protein